MYFVLPWIKFTPKSNLGTFIFLSQFFACIKVFLKVMIGLKNALIPRFTRPFLVDYAQKGGIIAVVNRLNACFLYSHTIFIATLPYTEKLESWSVEFSVAILAQWLLGSSITPLDRVTILFRLFWKHLGVKFRSLMGDLKSVNEAWIAFPICSQCIPNASPMRPQCVPNVFPMRS